MIEVSVSVNDKITSDIARIRRQLKSVPKEAHKEFVALTPVRSGNARRNTSLQGDTIRANYPYAQRLDEGWSRQAPRGITRPWEQWLRKRIRQIMGR
jgi:hypothetical protein